MFIINLFVVSALELQDEKPLFVMPMVSKFMDDASLVELHERGVNTDIEDHPHFQNGGTIMSSHAVAKLRNRHAMIRAEMETASLVEVEADADSKSESKTEAKAHASAGAMVSSLQEATALAEAEARVKEGKLDSSVLAETTERVITPLQNFLDVEYLARVNIGSTKQPVSLVLDTGSSNLVVVGDSCKSGDACKYHKDVFNTRESTTFQHEKQIPDFNIYYGTADLEAQPASDSFYLGDYVNHGQKFGDITKMNGWIFQNNQLQGVLGLSLPGLARKHMEPFFSSIIEQDSLKGRNKVAFFMQPNPSAANAALWGGIDYDLLDDGASLTTMGVEKGEDSYWSVQMECMQIGTVELAGGCLKKSSLAETDDKPEKQTSKNMAALAEAASGSSYKSSGANVKSVIFDTGTTFYTFPTSRVTNTVLNAFEDVPCHSITPESHPDMIVTMKSSTGKRVKMHIPGKEYMVGNPDDSYCTPAFDTIEISTNRGQAMMFGEAFMRQYMTVYDRKDGDLDNAQVAFARSTKNPAKMKHIETLVKKTFKNPVYLDN